MKAKLVPLQFDTVDDKAFHQICDVLQDLYQNETEFLTKIKVGDAVPVQADAVLIPVMWDNVYSEIELIKEMIHVPIIVITTVHGVSLMFDWEAVSFLKTNGFQVFNPYNVDMGKTILKALALKREMRHKKFVVFQDTDYNGVIAEQFKIFYWWHDSCKRDILEKFGIKIVVKRFKDLCTKAHAIEDGVAREELKRWQFDCDIPYERPVISAIKLFLALRDACDEEGDVAGCGVNCLNEGYDSETTPCLAWNLLYQDRGIMWVCEGDTSSLMTEYLLGKTIDCSIFTTNIYPFLSGMPALSHEKIQSFPDVKNPDDHALLVHCGYLGCLPQTMCKKWTLRPPVLGWKSWDIVGENSVVVDAEVEKGAITLCKLHNSFESIFMENAELEEYVQYPGSDCRNGGLIRVPDGYKLMEKIYSHHTVVLTGKRNNQVKVVADIFGLTIDN
ncbi:MAG: hypothetical protein RR865_06915 [Clostridia bacterium]